jgi:hypothetical protein
MGDGRLERSKSGTSSQTQTFPACFRTSFANPAIDIGRTFSDTFAGIAPASVPAFIVFQPIGGAVAIGAIRTPYPDLTAAEAAEILLPHEDGGVDAA